MEKPYRFIGKSCVAFENQCVYEAEPETREFGECYAIKDESGDWYLYSMEFFEKNFVPVISDDTVNRTE